MVEICDTRATAFPRRSLYININQSYTTIYHFAGLENPDKIVKLKGDSEIHICPPLESECSHLSVASGAH